MLPLLLHYLRLKAANPFRRCIANTRLVACLATSRKFSIPTFTRSSVSKQSLKGQATVVPSISILSSALSFRCLMRPSTRQKISQMFGILKVSRANADTRISSPKTRLTTRTSKSSSSSHSPNTIVSSASTRVLTECSRLCYVSSTTVRHISTRSQIWSITWTSTTKLNLTNASSAAKDSSSSATCAATLASAPLRNNKLATVRSLAQLNLTRIQWSTQGSFPRATKTEICRMDTIKNV